VPEAAGCATALPRRASLSLRNDANPARDQLSSKWKGAAAVAREDFGDPTTTDAYALCVIDRTGGVATARLAATVPAGGVCGAKPCWKSTSTSFVYADAAAAQAGIRKIQLKAGAAGRAKATVKGKGASLAMPALPLATPVTVRLVRTGTPACWEAAFGAPSRNDAGAFKAKSD
jgi:hypothetical protein